MKKLFVSSDLVTLADHMISEIVKPENWKNPFYSPVVIFSDSKAEDWFKLHWIEVQNEKSGPVLMNLKSTRLETFLSESVSRGIRGNSAETMDAGFLRSLIISKLSSKVGDDYYFQTLDDEQVSSYLSKDNDINLTNLFDFATMMADLFIQYETTRDAGFISGWQKKLYEDVLGEGVRIQEKEYRTLAELVEINRKNNDGNLCMSKVGNGTLFVFGFSGMGQLYRNLLNEYAGDNILYVYTQGWKTDDTRTGLIDKLSGFGKENIRLWGEEYQWIEPSQKSDIISSKNMHFAAAVNKIREIEWVHSNICKLFMEGKAVNSRDIIVAAPDINEYKLQIKQVFGQDNIEQSDFPSIPYSIADDSSENSFVSIAVQTLWTIVSKGYLSRLDLFGLIRNKYVQLVRKLSEDNIEAWLGWIDNTNVFRQHKDEEKYIDDWQTVKQRLLLSRLTNNPVEIEKDARKVLPFSDLSSSDDELLQGFISVIDELEYFVSLHDKETLALQDVDEIQKHLGFFLMSEEEIPAEFSAEISSYKAVCREIEKQKLLFDYGNECVYKQIFMLSLSSALGGDFIQSGKLYSGGIPFVNFKSNRILPAKYVFIIGLDSEVFPGTDSRNVLDLRTETVEGDDSVSERNKNALLCQLFAAGKEIFFSYVNKDLQKDQDFFRSSVLNALLYELWDKDSFSKFEDFEKETEYKLTIDEKRPWNELFTNREFRNKKNFLKLGESGSDASKTESYDVVPVLPDRVSISNLKKFLEEPFKFMAENRFSYDDDNSAAEEIEFEPVDYDNLESSILKTEYVKQWLRNHGESVDKESFIQELKLNNGCPSGIFGTKALDVVMKNAEDSCTLLKNNICVSGLDMDEIVVDQKVTCEGLKFHDDEGHYADKKWTLSGEIPIHNMKESDGELLLPGKITFFELKDTDKGQKLSCFLNSYISSLALVSEMGKENVEYGITLCDISGETISYDTTKTEAAELLELIYKKAYLENFLAPGCVPVDDIFNDKEYEDISGLIDELENPFGGSPWKYFSKADLFDKYHDIGYIPDETFEKQFEDAKDNIRKLIKFAGEKKNASN